jgi:hypothetical protein
MISPIRFGLRAPLWKREGLTRRFLQHYDGMVEVLRGHGIDLVLVAVGTGKGYIKRVSKGIKHWRFIDYPNNPETLGRKMAVGLARLRDEGVDAALNMGSDDFVSVRTILTLVSLMRSGVDFVGWSSGCYFVEPGLGKMLRWEGYPAGDRHDEPIGAGRCYSARLLDVLEWDLWVGGKLHQLDAGSWGRISKLRSRFDIRTLSSRQLGPLVDVKGSISATPWERLGAYKRRGVSTREMQRILKSVGLGSLCQALPPPPPPTRGRSVSWRPAPSRVSKVGAGIPAFTSRGGRQVTPRAPTKARASERVDHFVEALKGPFTSFAGLPSVVVSMPTIPGREKSARKVLDAILPQLSKNSLFVVHRNGSAVRHADPRVRMLDHPEGTGPLVRFTGFAVAEVGEALLTVDDDIVFPPTYVAQTLAALQRMQVHARTVQRTGAAVSWYARWWSKEGVTGGGLPLRHSGFSRAQISDTTKQDTPTTYGGCGVAAFSLEAAKRLIEEEKPPQYEYDDDVWMNAVLCGADIQVVRPQGRVAITASGAGGKGRRLFHEAKAENFVVREANLLDAKSRWNWRPTTRGPLSHRPLLREASKPMVEPKLKSPPEGRMISLFVPAYRAERWIQECADSLLTQKLPAGWQLELLIGVDGCPATLKAALEIDDPRVGIVEMAENVGTYVTLNTLLRYGTGELVFWHGADDVLVQGALRKMLKMVLQGPLRSVGKRYKSTDENLRVISESKGSTTNGRLSWRAAWDNAVGAFQPWRCGADMELVKRGWATGLQKYVVPEPLLLRRTHPGQLTQAEPRQLGSEIRKGRAATIKALEKSYARGYVPQPVIPVVGPVKALYGKLVGRDDAQVFDSAGYWSSRYARGGTSGAGSSGAEAAWKIAHVLRVVKKYGLRSVLDIGIGDGHIALTVAESLFGGGQIDTYRGVDVAPEAVECVQAELLRRAGKGSALTSSAVRFRMGDASVGYPMGSAAAVLCFDVLFHLPSRRAHDEVLRSIARSTQKVAIVTALVGEDDGRRLASHCFFRPFVPPEGLRVVEEHKVPGTQRKMLFVLEATGER